MIGEAEAHTEGPQGRRERELVPGSMTCVVGSRRGCSSSGGWEGQGRGTGVWEQLAVRGADGNRGLFNLCLSLLA